MGVADRDEEGSPGAYRSRAVRSIRRARDGSGTASRNGLARVAWHRTATVAAAAQRTKCRGRRPHRARQGRTRSGEGGVRRRRGRSGRNRSAPARCIGRGGVARRTGRSVIAPFVDAEFVRAHPDAVLADVRWYLDGRDGRQAFEAGHIPGALWVDLDHQLAAADHLDTDGRHPFPTPAAFAAAMGSLGIADDTVVIAYDDTGGLTAGRLAVMSRMIGCDATVLAGGLQNWAGPLEMGTARQPTPVTFKAVEWPADDLADAAEVEKIIATGGVAIDARSHERFAGGGLKIDKRAGHIPGAVCGPWSEVLDDEGLPRTADELRNHYRQLGVDDHREVVAYCGSGVSACLNVLAMERAGFDTPRLYVASWSGWSADPDRKAATGE